MLPYRRKDVYENHFLIKHHRAVPGTRRKMQHIAGLYDFLFIADREQGAPFLNQGHLFVWVIVRGRDQVRREAEAANHYVLADDHLALNAFLDLFYWNGIPVSL